MRPRNLSPYEKGVILQADRSAVVDALQTFFSDGHDSWAPLITRTSDGIKFNNKPGQRDSLSSIEIAQFLGMAGPTHCANGWAFFSRALNSALSGDSHAAWHFAYYAELRAAQSILAASGVGVFDSWNCVLNAAGSCKVIDDPNQNRALPTHVMTWQGMRALLDPLNPSAESISNAITFHGNKLGEIVSKAFPGTPSWRNTFTWITSWLFDLEQGLKDKAMRNRCSYQPHELTEHVLSPNEGIDFLDHFWLLFEPEPGATFIGIDKYLLRDALTTEATNKLRVAGVLNATRADIKEELEVAYERLEASFPNLHLSQDFIVRNVNKAEPRILVEARDRTALPTTPLPILARASLFLRLATGISKNLLIDAGVRQPEQLDFWLQGLARERGFVSSTIDIDSWGDLFYELQVATEDLVSLKKDGEKIERAELLMNISTHRACEAERAVFWGLAV